jgi:hypothetical protein
MCKIAVVTHEHVPLEEDAIKNTITFLMLGNVLAIVPMVGGAKKRHDICWLTLRQT